MLAAALAAGLEEALDRHGPPQEGGWRWDRIRHANIWHLLGLRPFSRLELPIRGGPGNLNPSSGSGTHGASWRMVVELRPQVRAWTIYPGGQSGNPLSRRYADRVPKWVEGELEVAHFPSTPAGLDSEQVLTTLDLIPGAE